MAHWNPVDQIQDLVNKMGGEGDIKRFLSGELELVPRDLQVNLLFPLGQPIEIPAVTRFIAEAAFTKANGIAAMGDNFTKFILPLVERDVAATTVAVFGLTRESRDPRIYTALDVDERGELALAHFFQVLQARPAGIRTDGWSNVAYILDADGSTWSVNAYLAGGGWHVGAHSLGDRRRWVAGSRFLSR